MLVDLTPAEHDEAVEVGRARWSLARANGWAPRWGMDPANQANDSLGALGEAAFAKAVGLAWSADATGPDHGGADVGAWHVRTNGRPDGDLFLHDEDADDEPFALVQRLDPLTYRVVGWCLGGEGKRAHWWRELQPGRPCYVVPPDALRPLDAYRPGPCEL